MLYITLCTDRNFLLNTEMVMFFDSNGEKAAHYPQTIRNIFDIRFDSLQGLFFPYSFVSGTIEFAFDSVSKSAIRASPLVLKLNVIDTYYDDL